MPKRPHIIIFNPDQWRADVMGHLGNAAAITPNLDRLAAEDGVSFRHAFCQNTVCTPSRCSFMTGWYTHVRGHRTMHHMLHPERGETNLLQVLKENGYYVWWGGKNDLVPGQDGFGDHCSLKYKPIGDVKPMWQSDREAQWRGDPESDTWYSFHVGCIDKGDATYYRDSDWANVEGAIELIRNYSGDEPLCIFLPLTYPHPPYGVEEPWFSAIDRNLLPPRVRALEDWRGKPAILHGIWEYQRMQSWSEERWDELRAIYYGMCARLDHQYGLLVEALKQSGIYDDSAIFVFADHGDFTGSYGLVEKTQNTFEDCLSNVPFLVKPPADVPVAPRVSDALVELIDFTATVYDLTGIDPGYDHFGKSLLPLLAGDTDSHRDAVFCEGGRRPGERQAMEMESGGAGGKSSIGKYWPRLRLQQTDDAPYHSKAVMCRTQHFKYVCRYGESDELYDLRRDPDEVLNVIDDPDYRPQVITLRERMLHFFLETADIVPRDTDKR